MRAQWKMDVYLYANEENLLRLAWPRTQGKWSQFGSCLLIGIQYDRLLIVLADRTWRVLVTPVVFLYFLSAIWMVSRIRIDLQAKLGKDQGTALGLFQLTTWLRHPDQNVMHCSEYKVVKVFPLSSIPVRSSAGFSVNKRKVSPNPKVMVTLPQASAKESAKHWTACKVSSSHPLNAFTSTSLAADTSFALHHYHFNLFSFQNNLGLIQIGCCWTTSRGLDKDDKQHLENW